jgi:hypothetical protein
MHSLPILRTRLIPTSRNFQVEFVTRPFSQSASASARGRWGRSVHRVKPVTSPNSSISLAPTELRDRSQKPGNPKQEDLLFSEVPSKPAESKGRDSLSSNEGDSKPGYLVLGPDANTRDRSFISYRNNQSFIRKHFVWKKPRLVLSRDKVAPVEQIVDDAQGDSTMSVNSKRIANPALFICDVQEKFRGAIWEFQKVYVLPCSRRNW